MVENAGCVITFVVFSKQIPHFKALGGEGSRTLVHHADTSSARGSGARRNSATPYDVAWPVLSAGMIEHRRRIRAFEYLLGDTYAEEKSVAGPIFLVPWEALRTWGHKNPSFAPAFLMRIVPVFEVGSTSKKNPDRSGSRIVLDLLDELGDRQDVLSPLGNNMMTFSGWGSMVPYHEQYKEPLQRLLSHHRPSVVAWARSQLEAQEKLIFSERSRDEEQKFFISCALADAFSDYFGSIA
jgi:hypothetical protein